jgi:hypothetical protein
MDHIETYVHLMHEVKRRHKSIESAYAEPDRLIYKAVTIDHCYTQLRKILELIAFSVLSANQHALTSLQHSTPKEYHAEKVLRAIERKFGKVYPTPVIQEMDPAPGIRANFRNKTIGFLTREEFSKLYAECGNVLHGRNPFRKPLDLDYYWLNIPSWSSKVRELLDSHIATIVNDPNLYLVQMSQADKMPTITTFSPAPL